MSGRHRAPAARTRARAPGGFVAGGLRAGPVRPPRLPRGGPRGLAIVPLLLAASLLLVQPAAAEEPGRALLHLAAERGQLLVSLEVQRLFGEAVRETLQNGFTSTVATRLLLEEAATGEAIAESRFSREIRFDIWEETFSVTTYSDQGTGLLTLRTLEEVEEACRRIREYRFGPLALLAAGRAYRFRLEYVVVPISQEQLERTKRWVQGGGSASGASGENPGSGLSFGSVMNLFIGRSTGVEETRSLFLSDPFRPEEVKGWE